ncbi:MAG TPA: organic hydroperoxide resistance protein [Chitinophagaceae bacterium]|jgi:Ohr subfamily peroxiredoxin|nr:organic hydroperoxide resistance protein [Chitinophagaceae bacterium]
METTTKKSNVLYTARTHTTGGREHGLSRSSDGHLEVRLSTPGTDGVGTNPEQLFAAGWSACFEGAMQVVARKRNIHLPADTVIDAEVDLCMEKGQFYLQARLNVSIPGLDKTIAYEIVEASREVCPYSKAIRNNIKVDYNVL